MGLLKPICVGFVTVGIAASALSQEAQPPSAAVVATVNGQPIYEAAVTRALKGVPAENQAQARVGILNHLIDQTLLDQYLLQLKVEVPDKDIDARVQELRDEVKKSGKTLEKMLEELSLTEPELRKQLTAELRWEKFTEQKVTEEALRDYFAKNPETFDGTTVHARHILLTPVAGDAQALDQAKQKLLAFKKQMEDEAGKEIAK